MERRLVGTELRHVPVRSRLLLKTDGDIVSGPNKTRQIISELWRIALPGTEEAEPRPQPARDARSLAWTRS